MSCTLVLTSWSSVIGTPLRPDALHPPFFRPEPRCLDSDAFCLSGGLIVMALASSSEARPQAAPHAILLTSSVPHLTPAPFPSPSRRSAPTIQSRALYNPLYRPRSVFTIYSDRRGFVYCLCRLCGLAIFQFPSGRRSSLYGFSAPPLAGNTRVEIRHHLSHVSE